MCSIRSNAFEASKNTNYTNIVYFKINLSRTQNMDFFSITFSAFFQLDRHLAIIPVLCTKSAAVYNPFIYAFCNRQVSIKTSWTSD